MIAGTKAQAVIAIIEKYRLNYEIQFWDNTWWQQTWIDCKNVS
jgi:hypothetical protein